MKRRTILTALSAASLLGLGGAPLRGAFAQQAGLKMTWWGNAERERRTREAISLFLKKYPGSPVDGQQFSGTLPILQYLEQSKAKGEFPDITFMDFRFVFDLARGGSLLDLREFIPSSLDLSSFPADVTDHGKTESGLYAVTLGLNSQAVAIDGAALAGAGIAAPGNDWTWEDLKRIAIEYTKAKGGAGWGSTDLSRSGALLEAWVMQRGKVFHNVDGSLGFAESDVIDWFTFWEGVRQEGGLIPLDKLDTSGKLENADIVRGVVAMQLISSNQNLAIEAAAKRKLELRMLPRPKGAKSGQYLKPSMLIGVSAESRDLERAVSLVSFLVTDPDAALISGLERGVPASSIQANALEPHLTDVEKRQLQYIKEVTPLAMPLPPPPPRGSQDILQLLPRISEAIATKRYSIEEGAKLFFRESQDILRRS